MRKINGKRIVSIGILAVLALSLGGCGISGLNISIGGRKDVAVSGSVKTKTLEGEATSLTVENIYVKIGTSTGGPKVELLSDGGRARVEVEAAEELLDAVVVKFSGGSLRIHAASDRCYVTAEPVKIRLYNYDFEKMSFSGACEVTDRAGSGRDGKDLEITLSGASTFTTDSVRAELFRVDLSGASRLEAGSVRADHFKLDLSGASVFESPDCTVVTKCDWHISGASSLSLSGTGKDLFAVVGGASRVKSFDFVQETCVITVSGASTVECHMTQSLGGSILHASAVYYHGDPETTVEVGSSAVLQKK